MNRKLWFTVFAIFTACVNRVHAGTLFVTDPGVIGEYSTDGTTINAQLVTGLITNTYADPFSISISGSNLFIGNWVNGVPNTGFIGEYTTSGGTVNSHLITGLNLPWAPAISGNDLYVGNAGSNVIGHYTITGTTVNANLAATSGDANRVAVLGTNLYVLHNSSLDLYNTSGNLITANLITGLNNAVDMTISGSDLYILNDGGNATGAAFVGKYTTAGVPENTHLISGLSFVQGIAVDSSNIYLSLEGAGAQQASIAKYTTSGSLVNGSLITGLTDPSGLVVVDSVPEPASLAVFVCGTISLLVRRRRSL